MKYTNSIRFMECLHSRNIEYEVHTNYDQKRDSCKGQAGECLPPSQALSRRSSSEKDGLRLGR